MTSLTQNLGHRPTAPTVRIRRPVDPTDTIVRIGQLPSVPAPRPRHPGGDDTETCRGAARERSSDLTPREIVAWALALLLLAAAVLVCGVVLGEVLADAAGIQR